MKKTDTVVTLDRTGRRRFIRAGSAFLLAGSTVVNAQNEGRVKEIVALQSNSRQHALDIAGQFQLLKKVPIWNADFTTTFMLASKMYTYSQ